MTRKVVGSKLKTRSFIHSLICFFTFALLFFYSMSLVGCKGHGSGVVVTGNTEAILADQKKAALLKELDRKFENPEAHFELGKLYQDERAWSKAEYYYRTALSFDITLREAQAGLVKVFLESGQTAKAKTIADEYMNQVSNSAGGSYRLGFAFQKQLLDEYAFACYQQALRLAPNSASIHRQLGYYYLSKGDKVRAEEYLKRSFQLNPLQPDVAGELGRLGVEVRIPRKTEKRAQKLDKIAEELRTETE